MGSRPRIIVVGGGFAGLSVVRGSAARAGRRAADRSRQPPHLPAAAVPGRDRGTRRAVDRRAAAPHPAAPGQRHRVPRRRARHRCGRRDASRTTQRSLSTTTTWWWPPARRTRISATTIGRRHAPGLKTLEDAFAIRARILNAFEQAEMADDDGAARRVAQLRDRRWRPDRRGTGRHAGGNRAPHAEAGIPAHRSGPQPRAPDRGGTARAAGVSRETVGGGAAPARATRRRSLDRPGDHGGG